jgi:hypothetical protein
LHLREIRKVHIDLEHLFARDHALRRWHLAQKAVDEGRLPCTRSTGDEDRCISDDRIA